MCSNVQKYDLHSPELRADPHAAYADLRRNEPVYRQKTPDGHSRWFILRHEDVELVMRDTRRFVHNRRNALPPEERNQIQPSMGLAKQINSHLLLNDPPDHTRLRTLVNKAFTPRIINRMRGRVQSLADSLLDKAQAKGEMDLINDYAYPVPLTIIAELLGIPTEDNERFRHWSQTFIYPHSNKGALESMQAFMDYLDYMFAKRRQQPEDDLLTSLVHAEEAGDKLNSAELTSMVVLLLAAGHETTVNLIGNGSLTLMQHPDQLNRLHREPSLIESAVEELLRYEGPVERATTRWATEDIRLGGKLIRQGDPVRVVLTSANRDMTQFDDPDTLDILREGNKRHMAFGHGVHYCLGAPLARMEGQIAIGTLFRRMPRLRLKVPLEELQWGTHRLMRGVEAMPVTWD